MSKKTDKHAQAKRIEAARVRKGLSQEECARRANWSPQVWNNIERGRTRAGERLFVIAKILDVSAEYLYDGREQFAVTLTNGDKKSIVNYDKHHPVLQSYACVITWQEAGNTIFCDSDIKDYDARQKEQRYAHSSSESFLLMMDGDSMNDSTDHHTFLPGDKLHFDPATSRNEPKHFDYVIAREKKSDSAIFRQLIVDCGKKWLVAKNMRYPAVRLTDEFTIFGILIFQGRDLRS